MTLAGHGIGNHIDKAKINIFMQIIFKIIAIIILAFRNVKFRLKRLAYKRWENRNELKPSVIEATIDKSTKLIKEIDKSTKLIKEIDKSTVVYKNDKQKQWAESGHFPSYLEPDIITCCIGGGWPSKPEPIEIEFDINNDQKTK